MWKLHFHDFALLSARVNSFATSGKHKKVNEGEKKRWGAQEAVFCGMQESKAEKRSWFSAKKVVEVSVVLVILFLAAREAYRIRLYAINTYGRVIHEFDPWFVLFNLSLLLKPFSPRIHSLFHPGSMFARHQSKNSIYLNSSPARIG